MFHHQYEIILTVKKSIIFLTKKIKQKDADTCFLSGDDKKEKPLSLLGLTFINGTIGTEHLKEFLGRT